MLTLTGLHTHIIVAEFVYLFAKFILSNTIGKLRSLLHLDLCLSGGGDQSKFHKSDIFDSGSEIVHSIAANASVFQEC